MPLAEVSTKNGPLWVHVLIVPFLLGVLCLGLFRPRPHQMVELRPVRCKNC